MRPEQINETIQRAVNEIFLRELEHDEGVLVTVTRAEVSKDHETARVFVQVFPETAAPRVVQQLRGKRHFFSVLLRDHVRGGTMPELVFVRETPELAPSL